MSLSVVLDSNSYISDYRMTSPAFSALFDFVGKTGSEIVLLKLVEEEVLANYERDFNEKVLSRWDKKIKGILISEELTARPDLSVQLAALQDRLIKPATKVRVVRIADYPGVTVDEVVRRGIHRIPPASSKGEELRDVVLWLAAVGYAKQKNVELSFITNDSGFWEQTADQPLPQIQKDIADAQISIKLYRRVEAFLAANILTRQAVDEKWAIQLFEAAKLGDLLVNRMVVQKFNGSILSQTIVSRELESGFLYDIGGDARFVELVFGVKCDLQLQSYVIRYSWPGRVETGDSITTYSTPPVILEGQLGQNVPSAGTSPFDFGVPVFVQGGFMKMSTSVPIGASGSISGTLAAPQAAEAVVERIFVEARAKYSIRLSGQRVVEVGSR